MKVNFKINEGTTIEVECAKLQDAIKAITEIREAISQEVCGVCNSENTYPRHRNVDSFDFYEIFCSDCRATLQLGTSKDNQQLYKRRMEIDGRGKTIKDENGKGKYLPNNGWTKWQVNKKE